MLIIDENNDSYILHNVDTPTPKSCQHFWVLDLVLKDFTLAPLKLIEETWCKTVTVEIEGFNVELPCKWFVLIVDPETSLIDIINVGELSRRPYNVLVYDNERNFAHGSTAKVVDMSSCERVVNPSINRHQMHCHPISKHRWIAIGNTDGYVKYLKDCVLGDLI